MNEVRMREYFKSPVTLHVVPVHSANRNVCPNTVSRARGYDMVSTRKRRFFATKLMSWLIELLRRCRRILDYVVAAVTLLFN